MICPQCSAESPSGHKFCGECGAALALVCSSCGMASSPGQKFGHTGALAISHEYLRWAWPLAARAAHDLGDTATVRVLLALLDRYPPGQLARMQRAERDLARARHAAAGAGPDAGAAFTAAIAGLRQHSTPYHLAHGLLDHAQHLLRLGDTGAAEMAAGEARGIAQRLRCQPLLDRAGELTPTKPGTQV